jgi:hypothetical protein
MGYRFWVLFKILAESFAILLAHDNLLAWVHSRNTQVRRLRKVRTNGKPNAPNSGNLPMPPMVFSGELIHPAIEQLANGTAGKVPVIILQRDFGQLGIRHGAICSEPKRQANSF